MVVFFTLASTVALSLIGSEWDEMEGTSQTNDFRYAFPRPVRLKPFTSPLALDPCTLHVGSLPLFSPSFTAAQSSHRLSPSERDARQSLLFAVPVWFSYVAAEMDPTKIPQKLHDAVSANENVILHKTVDPTPAYTEVIEGID